MPACWPFFRFGHAKAARVAPATVITIPLYGLNGAGKSTLLLRLQREPPAQMRPTWGFVNAFVQFGKSVLRIYDVGGNINIRGIWKNYIAECHGMMFVVDGADPNTLDEARAELHNLYSQPRCRGKPLLIVLTRADSSAYLGYDELIKRLDISSLRTQAVAEHQTIGLTSVNVCECDCTIYSVIGKRIDPRINNGVARLVETIELNRVYIEDRIRHDTAVQKQEYLDEQQQKRQRVDQYKSAPLN